jgi:hypothetical protein
MTRRQVRLEGISLFIINAEMLNLRFSILLHLNRLDDFIAE